MTGSSDARMECRVCPLVYDEYKSESYRSVIELWGHSGCRPTLLEVFYSCPQWSPARLC